MPDPRLRGLTGFTVNEKLLSAAIRRAIIIARLREGVGRELVGDLNRTLLPLIIREVERGVGQVRSRGILVDARARRSLQTMIQRITKEAGTEFVSLRKTLVRSLRDIAKNEIQFQVAAFTESLPTGVSLGIVTPALAPTASKAVAAPVRGRFLVEAFDSMGKDMVRKIESAVNLGLREGETALQITKRLSGLSGGQGGVFGTTRRHLHTWARSSVSAVSNGARELTYLENDELISGVRYVSVLDARVTEVCMSLDGSVFPINEGERPPMHHQALPSGEVVTTRRGPIAIEHVRVGDEVLTHRGRWRRVYAVMGRPVGEESVWEIESSSGHIVRATDDHPVLTAARGWLHTAEIKAGDEVFEYVEKRIGVQPEASRTSSDYAILLNAHRRPTEARERVIPQLVATFAGGVSASVQLQRDLGFYESEVYDEGGNRVLETCNVSDPLQEERFALSGGVAVRPRLALGGAVADYGRGHRVIGAHSPTTISTIARKSPWVSSAVMPVPGERFALPHMQGGALPLRSYADAVASAPARESGLPDPVLPLDGANRLPLSPMLPLDERGDDFSISKVHSLKRTPVRSVRRVPYQGMVWNLAVREDETYVAGGIVVHNCRSTTVPVLKSAEELFPGRGFKSLSEGQRASMNGTVPATTTYQDWLRGQPASIQNMALGPGRAELFRSGKLTDLRQLLDGLNRPLTLRQLRGLLE